LSKVLQATKNAFLADHVIGGNQVLPTVCAIAWMAKAAENIYEGYQYQGLGNYKLFKGITFDGLNDDSKQDYFTDLKLLSGSAQLAEGSSSSYLRVEARISSLAENPQGRPVFHYSAELILAKTPLTKKYYEGDFPDLSVSASQKKDAQDLYQNGTLFHGESLQGIQAILRCDQQGLLLACRVPELALARQGEFVIGQNNIFADDLVYQAMLVWVRKQLGLGSLPSSTKAWTVYRAIEAGELFYLQLDVLVQQANRLVADIVLIDQDKQIVAEINSAEVTASESLNELFKHA